MKSQRILIAGCGDVGTHTGLRLLELGHRVWGLKRHPENLPKGITGIAADLLEPSQLEAALPDKLDYVIYSVAASAFNEQAYHAAYVEGLNNLLQALTRLGQQPKRVLFVSSTSVYHQQDGEWVDEETPVEPQGFAGRAMLEAEQLLASGPLAATSIRFAGIYGPGRERLIRQVQEGRLAAAQPVQYSNRIHRDDCAGVLAHLIERDLAGEPLEPLYVASDSDPAPLHEVMAWLAKELKVTPTEGTTDLPLRRRASKRCRNARLLASGYRFIYPSYRDGYKALLKAMGLAAEISG